MATTVRSKVGNLPSALTTFIGRRRELTAVKRLLSSARLVTLTGIGGVGKTRLALRVAEDVRRDFADGVWLVELAELHDPELVPDTVAAVFGLHDQAARSPMDLLVEHFADRDALLILDNCEHLVAAAAELTSVLLRECPRVRVLATSREPLGVGGEAILRVPPLAVPDPDAPPTLHALPRYEAVTLFVDRARSALPDFVVTEYNRVAIARICHRLDGLPLPIELAAARVRALSPDQILERLTDRFRLLTAGSRVAPTRQQTLRCSVDWSYELCTPKERRMWTRLAVFSGGFELDAAEGICVDDAAPGEVLDVVASLVDKSILLVEGSGPVVRYGMFETLRDYGLEKLEESGEQVRCRRHHRDWFRGFAERAAAGWIGPRQPESIARLDREQANLRDALEFCVTEPGEADAGVGMAVAIFPFWFCRGMFGEARRWLARTLERAEDRPDRVRVGAMCAASQLAGMQDDFAAGADLIAHAAHLAELIGDPLVDATVAHACGRQAMFRREFERATGFFEQAVGPFREEADPHRLICVLQGLGLVGGMSGDIARAKACHEEVVAITAARGECEFRARAMFMLGVALWWQGDRARASGLFVEALQLTRRVDDHFGGAGCLESMAWGAAALREGERAAILSGAAEALRQSMGVSVALITTMLAPHEECRRLCRQILGDRAFEAAFANGAALEFAEAVDYALGRRDGFELSRAEMEAPTAPMRIVMPTPETPALTRRESQVADLVARGLTNREIAEKLVISPRTAEGHVERVLAKLGFGSRAQIAAWVAEHDRT
ncbi:MULTISPECIES: ATP-binding protein [unclassified Rhodococcus (in: high G+C Gram-positive bacteria)]|uniref:ATP-binding protein n=1 Tax=unclassified Rhodococcus (in: high G+C Gram-positive bacteria) TaxID=192944 RepID=UPI000E0C0C56|nr:MULTISPECIES: LuxR C-terminal-related transcriptional regulator [unclassified Rhodococcus (in: high G+C Gram-positive bacteria)]QKT10822.1 LuxR family transcriptional regulator [Rhodococcus sp. W8901]RDI36006.1 putative ATPase [Rhodococcus sp. AG1013]